MGHEYRISQDFANLFSARRPVVQTLLNAFFKPVAFPSDVLVGLRVDKLGRSSVSYTLGLFSDITVPTSTACAVGAFVHVYVTPEGRPSALPDDTRSSLEELLVGEQQS